MPTFVRHPLLPLFALFTALCVAIQLSLGAYATGRELTADEAAHFVNSLLIYDWVREAPLTNPLRYAQAYYLHFPRVSIGHWPPLFYVLQAAVFAVAGRSGAAVLGFQAVIAGLACAWPASLVQRRLGWLAGLGAGLFVLASPNLMFLIDAMMLDTALGVWIVAAALCWARFAARPRLVWALLFAAAASGAILTKGNGFALALLPPLHAALTRSLRPLLDWRAWLAAILVGAATLPWHLLTWHMTADGFVFAWGWDYTSHALPAYAAGLVETIGAVGIAGFAAGVWHLARQGGRAALQDQPATALASATLALLVFQLVAPADVAPRYLVALVPAAAVPIALGIASLLRLTPLRPAALAGATALVLVVGAAAMARPPHLSAYGIPALVGQILEANGPNHFILAAGSSRAEGAVIADLAERDPGRRYYALRASQLLSQSGFMAQNYRLRFADAAAVRRWFDDSGIGWLVLDLSGEAATLPHNLHVAEVAATAGWKLVADVWGANGEVRLYRLQEAAPSPAQVQALLSRVMPNTVPMADQRNSSNLASTASGASSAK